MPELRPRIREIPWVAGHDETTGATFSRSVLLAGLGLLHHGFHPVGKTAGGHRELFMAIVTRTISRATSCASSCGSTFHCDWNSQMKRPSRAARHASIARRSTASWRSSSPNYCIRADTSENGNVEGSS